MFFIKHKFKIELEIIQKIWQKQGPRKWAISSVLTQGLATFLCESERFWGYAWFLSHMLFGFFISFLCSLLIKQNQFTDHGIPKQASQPGNCNLTTLHIGKWIINTVGHLFTARHGEIIHAMTRRDDNMQRKFQGGGQALNKYYSAYRR